MSRIGIYSQYGDVRSQARQANHRDYLSSLPADTDPHGLTIGQIRAMQERFESFLPQMTSSGKVTRDFITGLLPEGASLTARTGGFDKRAIGFGTDFSALPGSGGSSRALITQQRPYQPEFESPDRQQYPIHRILANRYWRLFYKMDPVIGNCIEMYGDMPWSDYELVGEGVDGEVKHTLHNMCEITKLRSKLPYIVREFFVTGEAIPHLHYNDNDRIWTYIALHNPDQLEVIHAPFIDMEPIMQFIPDDRLRQVLMSDHYLTKQLRESIPSDLINRLISRQNIELNPVSATLIARKLHPYDTRGTSIISRMWRILMYEDAIFNASIATARRHAGPIKIAKLGNPQTGWIPDETHETRLMELLAQAELDVNAWIVYHYGVQFEMVGTTDRVMTIDRHWDIIERIKLVAMGLSKAFVHGEVTYASAAAGLTVFLQRLKALREYIEDIWLYPKFFRQIAIMNSWIKPTKAEVSHRVKVRRSYREVLDDNRYIVPKIRWQRTLDPAVNQEVIQAIQALENVGVNVSDTSKFAAAGMDFETELMQQVQDAKLRQSVIDKHPDIAQILMPQVAPGGGPGGVPGGGGLAPPAPAEAFEGFEEGAPPGGIPVEELETTPMASVEADSDSDEHKYSKKLTSNLWKSKERYGNWHADDIIPLKEIFKHGETDDELWADMVDNNFRLALSDSPESAWDAVEDWLIDEGFPNKDILDLKFILEKEGILDIDGKHAALLAEEQQLIREIDMLPKDKSKILFAGEGANQENRYLRDRRLGNKIGMRASIRLREMQRKNRTVRAEEQENDIRAEEHRLLNKRRSRLNSV